MFKSKRTWLSICLLVLGRLHWIIDQIGTVQTVKDIPIVGWVVSSWFSPVATVLGIVVFAWLYHDIEIRKIPAGFISGNESRKKITRKVVFLGVVAALVFVALPLGIHYRRSRPASAMISPASVPSDNTPSQKLSSQPPIKPPSSSRRIPTRIPEKTTPVQLHNPTWERPITKILPPRADESKMYRAFLEEKDKILGMEPKEAIAYYRRQASELDVFNNAWLPIENQFDSDAPVAPLNETPQEQRRYLKLVKLDQIRLSNYLKYRNDLPKVRDEDFRETFPLVNAQLDVLADKCTKKGVSVQDEPGVNRSENAPQIAAFFRTNADRCLSGN